ncbi:MAG: hypothetical protein WCD35_16405 [Mycobacteriales bacterium]
MPGAFSGHNGYGLWGPPPESTTTVVAVGIPREVLQRAFVEVRPAGRLHNIDGIDNDEQGRPLFVCTGPRRPWAQLWPELVHYG